MLTIAFSVLFLVMLLLLVGSLILPWVHSGQIRALRREVDAIKRGATAPATAETPPQTPSTAPRHETASPPTATATAAAAGETPTPTPDTGVAMARTVSAPAPSEPKPAPIQEPASVTDEPAVSLEHRFGARLPVWVGSIALAFAGFYLVKYSIESGLLGPLTRVSLGSLFGLSLLFCGGWVSRRTGLANGTRIGQALSGAGIAVLYGCLFAAASLYHLVPPYVAFAGMALVTGTAVMLSLRHGAPIAVLGLAGGFLTPAMVGGADPAVPLLFTYLYLLLAGVLMVARQRAWWGVAAVTIAAGYAWVALALWWELAIRDGPWLAAYLLAVAVTGALASGGAVAASAGGRLRARLVGGLAVVGAVLLMGPVTAQGGMELLEWTLFALLAAACVALAAREPESYGAMPLVSLLVSVALLLRWEAPVPTLHLVITGIFALIHGAGALWLLDRGKDPVRWANLATAAGLAYFLAAFMKLHIPGPGLSLWALAALMLGALWGVIGWRTGGRGEDPAAPSTEAGGTLIVGAGGFVTLGLLIQLDPAVLPVLFAVMLALVTWLDRHLSAPGRNRLLALFTTAFAVLMAPYLILMAQALVYGLTLDRVLVGTIADLDALIQSTTGLTLFLPRDFPAIGRGLLELGLPAIALGVAAWRLHGGGEPALVRRLETASVILVALFAYVVCRRVAVPDAELVFSRAGFIERGLVTNAWLVIGLACMWIGDRTDRPALAWAGSALWIVAVLRIVWFDMIILNPCWSQQSVGAMPLLNGISLTFGLPLVWMALGWRLLDPARAAAAARWFAPLAAVLIFALVNLSVRHWFHGSYLDRAGVGEAELYTYSVAWLVLGIGLMALGTTLDNRAMRLGSLALMTITVGKVFLVDAAELTGLYRVLSFLGLGLFLLGLSHVYTRFVDRGAARERADAPQS